VYTGSAQRLLGSSGTVPSAYEMRYAVAATRPAITDGFSAALPEGTDAGTYNVWWYADGGGIYADSEISAVSVDVTIAKAVAEAITTPQAVSVTHDGSEHNLVTSGSALAGFTVLYAVGAAEAAPSAVASYSAIVPTAAAIGTYNVWWYVQVTGDTANYDDSQKSLLVSKINAPPAPSSPSDGGKIEITVPDSAGTGFGGGTGTGVTAEVKVPASVIADKSTDTVVIPIASDEKAAGADIAAAQLDMSDVAAIAEAGKALELQLPQGTATLDSALVKELAERYKTLPELVVTVSREDEHKEAPMLTEAQKIAVTGADTVFEISIRIGGLYLHEFPGGSMRVILPYEGDTQPGVDYLEDNGMRTRMPSTWDKENKTVSFTTDHCSTFLVTTIEDKDVEAVNEGVAKEIEKQLGGDGTTSTVTPGNEPEEPNTPEDEAKTPDRGTAEVTPASPIPEEEGGINTALLITLIAAAAVAAGLITILTVRARRKG
jgi:hypothetical protein